MVLVNIRLLSGTIHVSKAINKDSGGTFKGSANETI